MRNLYVHVPFCAGKCDYCAFYSEPTPDAALIRQWLDRILFQLEENAPRLKDTKTVYFGGGTPSLLPDDILKRLFSAIHEAASDAAEISIEANPFTITPEKAAVLTSFSNRVTLGVQSFDPVLLEAIGRRHTAQQTLDAFALARQAGFDNINMDLIAGLPGDDPAGFAGTLEDKPGMQTLEAHGKKEIAWSIDFCI